MWLKTQKKMSKGIWSKDFILSFFSILFLVKKKLSSWMFMIALSLEAALVEVIFKNGQIVMIKQEKLSYSRQ